MNSNQTVYCLKCQSFKCSPDCSTSFIKELNHNQRVYCIKCQSFKCSPYCSKSYIKEFDPDLNYENKENTNDDSDSDFIPKHDDDDETISGESDETISDDKNK